MKKSGLTERSGVVRCQRCLKYGHYTYECQNQAVYRYRPSRTVMFKQKIKMQLNKDKGPKTVIKDRDYKRIYVEDRPSSEQQAQEEKKGSEKKQGEKEVVEKGEKQVVQKEQEQQSQSSSQSSESSSESESESQSLQPRKKRKI